MAKARATSQRDATADLFKCVAPLDNVYHSPKESPSCSASGRSSSRVPGTVQQEQCGRSITRAVQQG